MSYTRRITSNQPSAIMIMVDRSGSMDEMVNWHNESVKKSEAVASAINNMIAEIIARSQGDDLPGHYFDISVLGYSDDNVYPLLPGVGDSWFMTPAELLGSVRYVRTVERQRLLPDGRRVVNSVNERVWIEAGANSRTPMVRAFTGAYTHMAGWCAAHKDSFPPMVINITDGEITDGDPDSLLKAAARLTDLSTTDGNLILLNIHVSGSSDYHLVFPASDVKLPEERNAKLLHGMSSVMPEFFWSQIREIVGYDNSKGGFRGVAYNASVLDLVRMLNIGSSTVNNIL